MSSFDQPSICSYNGPSAIRHRAIVHSNKYRCPSYLMRVAPPKVYSNEDLRNMLVPKTYEVRKVVNLTGAGDGHQSRGHYKPSADKFTKSVVVKSVDYENDDDESTQQKYNSPIVGDDDDMAAIDARPRDSKREEVEDVVREIDDLSIIITEANDKNGNKKPEKELRNVFAELTTAEYDDRTSEISFEIPSIKVIDETTKNYNSNVYNTTDNSRYTYIKT